MNQVLDLGEMGRLKWNKCVQILPHRTIADCSHGSKHLGVSLGNRSKTGGGGMILRFPVPRESDSFWEWYRLPILTAFPTPS